MSRINPYAVDPSLTQGLIDYSRQVAALGLEHSLQELVKIRASQLNGCGVCLDLHVREARATGESEERIYMLAAWRESSLYTDRERAALAWTENLTDLAGKPVPDAVYDALAAHFTPDEQIKLTLLVGLINAFNRLGAGFHVPPLRQRLAA